MNGHTQTPDYLASLLMRYEYLLRFYENISNQANLNRTIQDAQLLKKDKKAVDLSDPEVITWLDQNTPQTTVIDISRASQKTVEAHGIENNKLNPRERLILISAIGITETEVTNKFPLSLRPDMNSDEFEFREKANRLIKIRQEIINTLLPGGIKTGLSNANSFNMSRDLKDRFIELKQVYELKILAYLFNNIKDSFNLAETRLYEKAIHNKEIDKLIENYKNIIDNDNLSDDKKIYLIVDLIRKENTNQENKYEKSNKSNLFSIFKRECYIDYDHFLNSETNAHHYARMLSLISNDIKNQGIGQLMDENIKNKNGKSQIIVNYSNERINNAYQLIHHNEVDIKNNLENINIKNLSKS